MPIDDIIANLSCVHPSMTVFTKQLMPLRHHYTNNIRIDDVLIKVKDTWQVDG